MARSMTQSTRTDEAFMRLALNEAKKGLGRTLPNPAVGAILVKHGRVIARGHHRRAGLPHAEIEALRRAGGRARGATLYVTLEPCAHVGRTGPCTDAILAAGITRVVVGCRDENPRVAGRGIAHLRRAHVAVVVGCLQDECQALYRGFFTWARMGRPLVTLKLAASLDGFIAPVPRPAARPRIHWITGEHARTEAHVLRSQHDAILVGVGTILADDPRLTVRPAGRWRGAAPTVAPLRIVLDSALRTPPSARIFSAARGTGANRGVKDKAPLIIAVAPSRDVRRFARRRRALERAGARVILVAADRTRRPSITAVLRLLAREGLHAVLVEGGSTIANAFLRARAVDRLALFFAPTLLGAGVPMLSGPPLPRGLHLDNLTVSSVGADLLLRADVSSSVRLGTVG